MASLVQLPLELFAEIGRHLDRQSIFTLRLTNRELERAIFDHFARRYFRKKGYLITYSSLAVLHSIAAHERLRIYVRHVWFNPDLYTFNPPRCTQQRPMNRLLYGHERPMRRAQRAAYRQCMADHQALLSTGTLESELQKAFLQLPNLNVIGMRRSERYSACGWSRLTEAVGDDPRVLGPVPMDDKRPGLSEPTRLFIGIVGAVAGVRSQCPSSEATLSLQRLYNDAIELDNIIPSAIAARELDVAFQDLQSLEINAAVIKGRPNPGLYSRSQELVRPAPAVEEGSGLARLLRSAPKLDDLTMHIQYDADSREASGLTNEEYMLTEYSSRCLNQLVAPPRLPLSNLTRLKLDTITTTNATFVKFLKPTAAKLTSLKLCNICILGSGTHDIRPWASVFAFLRNCTPELSLLIFHCMEHANGEIRFEAPGYSGQQAPPEEKSIVDYIYDVDEYPDGTGSSIHDLFSWYGNEAQRAAAAAMMRTAQDRAGVVTILARIEKDHWYTMDYSQAWHTEDKGFDSDTSDEEEAEVDGSVEGTFAKVTEGLVRG